MPKLPGEDVPDTPAPPLPGSGPQPVVVVPAWWGDLERVKSFCLALYAYDPQGAIDLWLEAKRLAGK